jgi:hypothetical protein
VSLSPEQSDDVRRLLADELRSAWLTAVEQGVSPAALADIVDERRRAVAASVAAGDDPPDLGDDPVNDAGAAD